MLKHQDHCPARCPGAAGFLHQLARFVPVAAAACRTCVLKDGVGAGASSPCLGAAEVPTSEGAEELASVLTTCSVKCLNEVTLPAQRRGDPIQDKPGNQAHHYLCRLS